MVRNEKILREMLLKMNYDSSKTLNENIQEQSRFELDFNRTYSDPKKAAQANREMSEFVSEYRHELIDIASIGAFFIPGVGPLISLGLELANSGLYYSEGDKYMAGFSLAFALIPGAELFAKIPSVKKLGRNGLAKLIKKVRAGRKLDDIEMEAFQKIVKESDWIKNTAKSQASIMMKAKKALKKSTLKDLVYNIYRFSKRYPNTFNISRTGLTFGGIWYSYEKLAKMYGFGEDSNQTSPSSQESVDSQEMVVDDFDSVWDYKKVGDKFYTKKKTSDKWILTSGKAKEAIQNKVFKDINSSSNIVDLESEFEENKDEYNTEYYNQTVESQDTNKLKVFWENYDYNS